MKQYPKIPEEAVDTGQDEQTALSQPPLTVMAIQELLGLFSPKAGSEQKDRYDYLKKKPLGLI